MPIINRVSTTDAPRVDSREARAKAFWERKLTCPNCSHTVKLTRAYTGKKSNIQYAKYDETDFECPDCKHDLILCKAIFGGYYFSMRQSKPNYAE